MIFNWMCEKTYIYSKGIVIKIVWIGMISNFINMRR